MGTPEVELFDKQLKKKYPYFNAYQFYQTMSKQGKNEYAIIYSLIALYKATGVKNTWKYCVKLVNDKNFNEKAHTEGSKKFKEPGAMSFKQIVKRALEGE